MAKWEGTDQGKKEADRIINLFLESREKGMSRKQIADQVFRARMPNLDPDKHEDSYPFLSGDTLRAFADIIFERDTTYLFFATKNKWRVFPKNNRSMRHGDVVFVKTDDVEQFALDIAPKLNRRFVLVTHNSDLAAPVMPKSLEMLDNNPFLIRWLAQNAALSDHPKLVPVPIGLQNQQWGRSGVVDRLEKFLRKSPPIYEPKAGALSSVTSRRQILVYANFSPHHHPLRQKALRTFAEVATVQKRDRDQLESYLQDVISSKFVLSPPGLGEDCHRTWESVLLGAIPVVANSTRGISRLFEKSPVYILKDWDNVGKDQFLNFQVRTRSRKLILAQYWFDLIDSFRAE